MELTLGFLDYCIRQEFRTVHSGRFNVKQPVCGIRFLTDLQSLPDSEKDILYLCKCDGAFSLQPQKSSDVSFEKAKAPGEKAKARKQIDITADHLILTLLSDSEFQAFDRNRTGYYLNCGDSDIFTVFNCLQRILDRFRLWQLQIMELSRNPDRLQELLNLTASYLQISLSIVSREYHGDYFSTTDDAQPWSGYYNAQNDMFADAMQNLYLQDPDFDRTFEQHGLRRWSAYITDTDVDTELYYYNIFLNDRYMARVLFMFPVEQVGGVPEDILLWLSGMIEDSYLKLLHRQKEYESKQAIRNYMDVLLEGTSVSLEQLAPVLGRLNWKVEDEYIVVKLVPQSYANSSQTLDYYCSRLEALTGDCVSLARNGGIYAVYNVKQIPDIAEQLRSELSVFLRDNMFAAGFSNIFSGLTQLKLFSYEAEVALALGTGQNPQLWVHHFSDYILDYSMLQMASHIPARELFHPAVRRMELYDQNHPDTELVHTLGIYLEEHFNASHAAQRLHIHRTTFLYRMKKIEELTGLNLEDQDTVLHLLLTYKMRSQKEIPLQEKMRRP